MLAALLVNNFSGGMPNIWSCGTPKYSGGTGEHAAARTAAATTRSSDFALIRPDLRDQLAVLSERFNLTKSEIWRYKTPSGSGSRPGMGLSRSSPNDYRAAALHGAAESGAADADYSPGARLSGRADRDTPRHPCASRARLCRTTHFGPRRGQARRIRVRGLSRARRDRSDRRDPARQRARHYRIARRYGRAADPGEERFRLPLDP